MNSMEVRARPAPIRYDNSSPSSDPSASHACAMALHALQDRVTALEAENAQLKAALKGSKTHSEPDTLRTRVRMLQETLQKSQETLRHQSSVLASSKDEIVSHLAKIEELELALAAASQSHSAELISVQSQLKDAEKRLEAATRRGSWLESELKTARSVTSSAEFAAMWTSPRERQSLEAEVRRLDRDLAESKRRESDLQAQLRSLESALQRSEDSRKQLLELQLKSKETMQDIVEVNERLVATVSRLQKRKTLSP